MGLKNIKEKLISQGSAHNEKCETESVLVKGRSGEIIFTIRVV
jgi:hypothetical protein